MNQLQMFCKQFEKIHFSGHRFLTGECNYGGRVVDINDRRLLISILEDCYNEESYSSPSFKLSSEDLYRIPENPTKPQVLEFISNLPLVAPPEVFGFHENADIKKSAQETTGLLIGTSLTQNEFLARFDTTSDHQKGRNETLDLCENILAKLPEKFDIGHVVEHFPLTQSNSLVVRHEVVRYNNLLGLIKDMLLDLSRGLKGEVNMVAELEEVQQDLALKRVPKLWIARGYDSLKPIGSYITDLVDRIKFFKNWIEDGEPSCLWISGFFFTQSVFTTLVLNCSKRTKTPIHQLEIEFKFSEFEASSRQKSMAFDDFVRVICT